MAFTTEAFALNSTPTLIAHATFNPMRVLVHNHEHQNNHDVYIGGSAVSESNGLHIPETETVEIYLAAGDLLWGVGSSNPTACRVFRTVL
jgi:hypothetical protein